jgi:predicted unusual protein kinase regulating ubiquinone biosynthesis (AarF/ABC1/UbiB family)
MRKVNKFADVESEKAQLDARIESAGQAKNTTETSEQVKDAEVMEYFTLQSEYAFVARALSQMDGVGKVLDPEFDFISAAAPYLVEVKGTGKYLTDEIKKKLTWVYGEEGILAKELKLFKSLGLKLPVKQ